MCYLGTVHFESTLQELEDAYLCASVGCPAKRPVIEMTIPSSLDPTLAPVGRHIIQLFIQYAPYDLSSKYGGGSWDDVNYKQTFVNRVYSIIEEYCPGFRASIVYEDLLSPLDLERIFGLYKGECKMCMSARECMWRTYNMYVCISTSTYNMYTCMNWYIHACNHILLIMLLV